MYEALGGVPPWKDITVRNSRSKAFGIGQGIISRWKRELHKHGEQAFPGKGCLKPQDEKVYKSFPKSMSCFGTLTLAIGFAVVSNSVRAGEVFPLPEPFPLKIIVTRPEKPPLPEPFPLKIIVTRPEKPPLPEPFAVTILVRRAESSKTKIKVIEATYGWNCRNAKPWRGHAITVSRGNATGHIAAECNGKEDCTYYVDYKKLGDPAVNCPKDYEVIYGCIPDGRQKKATLTPEAGWGNKAVRLTCP